MSCRLVSIHEVPLVHCFGCGGLSSSVQKFQSEGGNDQRVCVQSNAHYDQLINPTLSHGGEGRLIKKHFKADVDELQQSRRELSVQLGRRCAVCSGYCGLMRCLDYGHVTHDKVDGCDLEGHQGSTQQEHQDGQLDGVGVGDVGVVRRQEYRQLEFGAGREIL